MLRLFFGEDLQMVEINLQFNEVLDIEGSVVSEDSKESSITLYVSKEAYERLKKTVESIRFFSFNIFEDFVGSHYLISFKSYSMFHF